MSVDKGKSIVISEAQEQILLMDMIRLQYPKLIDYTLYIINERHVSPRYGAQLNRMGRLKGCSDIFIAYPSGNYHGLWIELKSKKGKPTLSQKNFIQRMNDIGYCAKVAYGADEAFEVVKLYINKKMFIN